MAWEIFGNRALRQGDWKLRWQWRPWGKGDWELFNLAANTAERKDVAADNAEKLTALLARWEEFHGKQRDHPQPVGVRELRRHDAAALSG